jgi:hypothetical protein
MTKKAAVTKRVEIVPAPILGPSVRVNPPTVAVRDPDRIDVRTPRVATPPDARRQYGPDGP